MHNFGFSSYENKKNIILTFFSPKLINITFVLIIVHLIKIQIIDFLNTNTNQAPINMTVHRTFQFKECTLKNQLLELPVN